MPAASTVTAAGAANEPAIVLTIPGVKTLSEPVAMACKPCEIVLPEIESVSLTEALRWPGRVGVKRTKTWQVLGMAPNGAGLSAPLQVLLVMLKSGPLPTIGVTRYSVVDGKADARMDTVARIDARADQLYRVRMDVHGDDFALSVQGQMVDSWSEPRLQHGGIGFFSARGEQSRLRWVQITHQYDMLGRLCAYLAPYNMPAVDGGSSQQ